MNGSASNSPELENKIFDGFNFPHNKARGMESKIIPITNLGTIDYQPKKNWGNMFQNNPETSISIDQDAKNLSDASQLFRLCVKNGEYVYVRADDIIMLESCDHLVKVYLGIGDKVKLTTRNNTLKDFLVLLPKTHFLRIGRFCAINCKRISGGNCNTQFFEFDFKISVKLKHPVSHAIFNSIGK